MQTPPTIERGLGFVTTYTVYQAFRLDGNGNLVDLSNEHHEIVQTESIDPVDTKGNFCTQGCSNKLKSQDDYNSSRFTDQKSTGTGNAFVSRQTYTIDGHPAEIRRYLWRSDYERGTVVVNHVAPNGIEEDLEPGTIVKH